MPVPAKYDITHYQGDTFDLVVTLPVDLTSAAIKFELKTPNAASATLELTIGSGISIGAYNATAGTTDCYITLTSTQSANLGTTVYFYDLETTIVGTRITWFGGRFAQIAQVSE